MALTQDTNYRGLIIPGAYIRVSYLSISDDRKSMSFKTFVYAGESEPVGSALQEVVPNGGQAQAIARTAAVMDSAAHMNVPYDIEGPNPFAQAYEYLKTLPAFAGAQDA